MINKLDTLMGEYAKLKSKEVALKEEKDAKGDLIRAEMKKLGMKTAGNERGTFSVYQTSTWKYTDKVSKLEAEVDALKVKEQETGKATVSYGESFRFTAKK